MRKRLVVVASLLFGCSSSDFEVAPGGSDSDSGTSIEDGTASDSSVPVSDTAIDGASDDTTMPTPDTGTSPSDTSTAPLDTSVPPVDGCTVTTDADLYFTTYSTSVANVSADTPAAISFTMMRTAQPVAMTFALQRIDIDASKSAGNLVIRLIRGTPTKSPAAIDVLKTVTVPATAIGDAASPIAIALGSTLPVLAKGDLLWFELTDASDRADFRVYGGAGTSPAVDLWYPLGATSSGYSKVTSSDPYLVVSVKGCF